MIRIALVVLCLLLGADFTTCFGFGFTLPPPSSFSSPSAATYTAYTHVHAIGRTRGQALRMAGAEEAQRLMEMARKMRQEAAALEASLPKREKSDTKPVVRYVQRSTEDLVKMVGKLGIGDLNTFAHQLDSLKENEGALKLWRSEKLVPSSVSMDGFKAESSIDPASLSLEGASFDYKKVLGVSLAVCTVSALSASYVGGEFGFYVGYLSALAPVGLVTVGTVAPGLIAAALAGFQTRFDEKYRRSLAVNAASTFLAGYLCGGSLIELRVGGDNVTNVPVFFDKLSEVPVKEGEDEGDIKVKADTTASATASSSRELNRRDLDALAVRALAGAVGECIKFGQSTGASAGLVQGLQAAFFSMRPRLTDVDQQNETRWAALTAYRLLRDNEKLLDKVTDAFLAKASLEECVACLEGY